MWQKITKPKADQTKAGKKKQTRAASCGFVGRRSCGLPPH